MSKWLDIDWKGVDVKEFEQASYYTKDGVTIAIFTGVGDETSSIKEGILNEDGEFICSNDLWSGVIDWTDGEYIDECDILGADFEQLIIETLIAGGLIKGND